MRILKQGSTGPAVELLQLALQRAGCTELIRDGVFGADTRRAVLRFQQRRGLRADGIAGAQTQRALLPWYTGYMTHIVVRGDTFYRLSQAYGTDMGAIETANPGVDAENLAIGSRVVVPLSFPVVPTDISYSSQLLNYCVRGLAARYPFISAREIGKSVMGRPIWSLELGAGENRVLYNASHHANEWICTPLLLKFTEELAAAAASGGEIYGRSTSEIMDYARLALVPMVNPDGVDLATGELQWGEYYDSAAAIAEDYPRYRFPTGWKANIRGVDLNLQYPAMWERARETKFAQGIVSPSPADFVGRAPLTEPESRAMYDYTLRYDPALILAYHSQGKVIYWQFQDVEVPGSRDIAEFFSSMSGYAVEDVPLSSGFAGYKDWFIQDFIRPGYTVEVGRGVNPLPIGQFDEIYRDNLGVLVYGALVT